MELLKAASELDGVTYVGAALLGAGVALLGSLLLLATDWPSPRRSYMLSKLPGPATWPFFGIIFEAATISHHDLLNWTMERLRAFPRLMTSNLMGANFVYMYHPQDLQVLLSSTEHITKGMEYDYVKSWLGDSLLITSGEKWHATRKLLTPSFHFKILEDALKLMNTHSKELCEKIDALTGSPVAIEQLITLCTLDIICESAMGISLGAQKKESQEYVVKSKRMSELLVYRWLHPWLKGFLFTLTEKGKEFYRCLDFLHKFTHEVIKEKRFEFKNETFYEGECTVGGKRRRAFLDCLLEVEARSPGSFSELRIREEVDTFMFEGHDTTSSALNFIFFCLATHPTIQEKVFTEIEEVFQEEDKPLTMRDLQKLTYTEKVIKESLRIFPSVPFIARRLQKDLVLVDGLEIPAGTNIIIATYKLHRDEEYYPNAEKFDPERFSEEQVHNRHPFAYLPFSAGPRNCIGQKFAMMELKTVVSTVVRRFKIEAHTKREEFKLVPLLTLKTDTPVECKFAPRYRI